MPKSFKIFLLLFSLAFSAAAQIGGKHTYQFLNLVNSPKQAALGGKNITGYTYDPASAFYNPATINKEMKNQLSLNYVSYFSDVNYGSAAYAFEISPKIGIIHAGITYINYGTFDGYDEFGNSTGTFTGDEVAASVGYAYNIPNSDFYAGANLKFITSKLEQYTSYGGAIDLGLTYLNEEKGIVASAVFRNIGTQFKPYDEVTESIPFEFDLGVSQKISELPIRYHITLENMQQWKLAFRNTARDEVDLEGNVKKDHPSVFNNALRHVILGLELFPDKGFNIRLGYSFRRSEELRIVDERAFAGLSGGISVKFGRFRLSYTYAQYSAAANTSFFGLNIDLGAQNKGASNTSID